MGHADEMAKLLGQLGASADEVAATLEGHSIQGVRNAVRFLNPIVRYLLGRVRADASSLDVMQGDRVRLTLDSGKEEVVMPEAVRQFLEAFSRGAYPALELPPDKT
jgi:hypothetical protein